MSYQRLMNSMLPTSEKQFWPGHQQVFGVDINENDLFICEKIISTDLISQ